jgi:uncharacterized Zn-finger protein
VRAAFRGRRGAVSRKEVADAAILTDRHSTGHFGNLRNRLKSSFCTFTCFGEFMNDKTTSAVELGADQLPAYCPNPAMPLWSSHPRVFLDFGHDGLAKCPYCGTDYRLKPGVAAGHH